MFGAAEDGGLVEKGVGDPEAGCPEAAEDYVAVFEGLSGERGVRQSVRTASIKDEVQNSRVSGIRRKTHVL